MTCWYETEARVRGGLDCALTCPPAPPPTLAPAASGGACDAIDVAGTDYGLVTGFAYDGLYEEAGACNGQPYYKCTCCTAYDPANDVDDPDECLSEKDFHHYVWYDGAAWQLRLYTGGAGDPWGWDECGGGSGWGDEYRLEDPDGDLAAASVEGTWEKQETDLAGGDMVYSWDAHPMTATCKADSSASAASGFNAILAGERGTPLQALLLMALIVAALLGVCCCYFSAKAVSGMLQASNAGPKKKRAAMALPRKVATVPGYELLGSPGPALAGHERTFFVRLPADARAGSQVKCSTPTGAPVFFRAPPGAGPGQTVYIPWYAPGEATVKAVAKPPRYRSALAPPPPPSPVPVKVLAPPPPPATAAPHVASVKVKAPAPHVTSVKIKAPAPHVASVKVKAPPPPDPRVSFGAAGLLGAAAARSKRRQEAARQQRLEAEQAEALERQAALLPAATSSAL